MYMYIMELSKTFIILSRSIAELKSLYSSIHFAMIMIEIHTCIRFKEVDLADQTTNHVVSFTLGTERYKYVQSVYNKLHELHAQTILLILHLTNKLVSIYFLRYIGESVLPLVLIEVVSINVYHCMRIMELSEI